MYEEYLHHEKKVIVRTDLKGKHREYCLCYECKNFMPDDYDKNCSIANLVFSVCVLNNIVTPVWECPNFLAL